MAFDLNNYETVKERKKRFYADHPDGRIIVESLSQDINDYALIKASIYFDAENQLNGTPKSTGYAHELRLLEKSVSAKGKEYEAVNYNAWVENCEESAIGRALDNAGYAGNDKCSREEMEKVERMGNALETLKADLSVLIQDKVFEGDFDGLNKSYAKCKTYKDFKFLYDRTKAEYNKRKNKEMIQDNEPSEKDEIQDLF